MPRLVLDKKEGILPTSEYDLFDGETIVGKIQIRHRPSNGKDIPEEMKNHIYYEIFPEYQGKGYGNKILELGLEEAKKIGLHEVYITCMEDNIPSKKIIENNGGEFVKELLIPSRGKKMLKYKIDLTK